jgi:RimJ/RimL family protein N-acetyltransferase
MLLFSSMLSAHAATKIRPTNCEVVLMPKRPLLTKRMQLRLVEKADEHRLMAIQSDPWVFIPSGISPEEAQLNFNFAVSRSVSKLMRSDLVAILNNEVIGTLSLTEVRDHERFEESGQGMVPSQFWLEVGFVFDPSQWGKGIATEAVLKLEEFAFTQILADDLVAETSIDNYPSQKVLKKQDSGGHPCKKCLSP